MEKRGLLPKDLYAIRTVGDADVSADGRYLAYVVQRIDEEKDKSLTDIYLLDLQSRERKRLTNTGKDSSPRFSPDGRRLAFLSSRSEKNQIWIMELDGGEAWRLPTKETVAGGFRWFPDGKRIVYLSNTLEKPEGWTPYPGAPDHDAERLLELAKKSLDPDKKKKDDSGKKNEVKVITGLRYRGDGIGYYGELKRQIFVAPVPEGAPLEDLEPAGEQITSGDYNFELPAISPDGRYLVTSARLSEQADYEQERDLWLWDIESRRSWLLYAAPGPSGMPLWSPSGNVLAFVGDDQAYNVSTTRDLWLLDVSGYLDQLAAGQEPEPLTVASARNITRPYDRPFGAHAGAELRYRGSSAYWAGDQLYFLMSLRGAAGIYRVDLAGTVEELHYDEHLAITSIAGNGDVLVYSASQPDRLEDLYLLGAMPEPLVDANASFLEGVRLGEWEKFTYESSDGQEIDGWIIYPLDYQPTEKYPLLLLIHGGPHGAYGPAFMFLGQIFAGQGYVVLFTNPHGSTTYGQEFTASIDQNWGVIDYDDLMRGVDHLIERGLVDPKRMFVHGWSFGGYMSCWIATQTNRFRAICGGAVVSNLLSGYGTSDIIWADEYEYGGQPWRDSEHLIRHSPIGHADKVETPFMLLHGENDLRCPVSQSEEFYTALKRLGKTAVMIRYPGEFHGLRRPVHRVDRYERLLAWFNYYNER